jgi:hypothetical protein
MAKEREYVTLEYDSLTLTLPTKIRQGEHRKIERLVIQFASQDFLAIKSEVGDDFMSMGEQATGAAVEDKPDEMSEQEAQATLTVLCGTTTEEIDDIDRDDFLSIKMELEKLYKTKTAAEREVGKEN